MSAKDLLFELLTEELPPRSLLTLSEALTAGLAHAVDAAALGHGRLHSFATPRRLAVRIEKLAHRQPDRSVERRGPPLTKAFDAQGIPTQAATAFALSCGVTLPELTEFKSDKGEWLQYRGTERGANTVDLLGGIIQQSIASLPIARRMRWGAGSAEFIRPVHGVIVLYGEDIVPIEVLGIRAGRETRGHRFHAPRPITLRNAARYVDALRRARVVVDFAARRELIRHGVAATAAAAVDNGVALIDAALLDEVTALVEWPVALAGRFEPRFLELPREVVIATIQAHQRYFPIERDGRLSDSFITVCNIESRDPARVREGNERVVRPRLSDAAFFWDQDRKVSLASFAASLSGMTFQTRLGSYADKTRRITTLAAAFGQRIGAGAQVELTASLCKADLMSAMVGEFPELQGIMGGYYAQCEGLPAEVATALEEHYRPRYSGDAIPSTALGQAVAIADKLDTLVGIFAIDQRPTGAKDPFGLRRAALGVLRILLEGRLDLDLIECLTLAAASLPVQNPEVVETSFAFMQERLRGLLLEQEGATPEMIDAIYTLRPSSPLDALGRLRALQEFVLLPEAALLAGVNKRIVNILKKNPPPSAAVEPAAFCEDAEGQLHRTLLAIAPQVHEFERQGRYADSLRALAALRMPVSNFFDRVMVMDDDPVRRNNRLGLLRDARSLLGGVFDLSRLPG